METISKIPDVKARLANNLLRIRRGQRLSQADLGYKADVDRSHISAIERQKCCPSIEIVEKLALGLEVEIGVLLA